MPDLSHILSARPLLKLHGKTWCALIALVTILAFISLVSASASHYHQTSQETQECSICSVVTDKVGLGLAAPALVLTQFVLLFAITATTFSIKLHTSPLPLPRCCGPPPSF